MGSDDLLLGFDAREMWVDASEEWNEERKTWLLHPGIVKPLSTDAAIWKSVFDIDETLQKTQWTGPIMGLWENLQELENMVSGPWKNRRDPYWTIAITLSSSSSSSKDLEKWKKLTKTVTPSVCDPAWQLLGYDVSDSWLISGLTNLSWGKDPVPAIGEKYIPHLNEYHLFQSVEPATEFIPVAEEAAAAHAPFFVLGIWLIKKEESLTHTT